MARSSKSNKVSRKIKVDMSGVETKKLVSEGEYKTKVTEITNEKSDAGKPYLKWVFEITDGDFEGQNLYYNTSLQPQALWNLKGLLEALGEDVPDSSMELDLDEYIDKEIGCVVEHETYEGRKQARIVDFVGADDVEEGDGKKTDDDDAVELPDDDAVDEMDEEELEAAVKEYDLDVELEDFKKLSKKRGAVKEALETLREANADGDDKKTDDDDGGITEDEVNDMSKEEMEEFVEANKLKVELEGSTGAQRKQLIKALKKADLLKTDD